MPPKIAFRRAGPLQMAHDVALYEGEPVVAVAAVDRYVAMTRAKDHLHLIVPQRFYVHAQVMHGDRHVYASRTRFIPERIAERFAVAGRGGRRGGGDLPGADDRRP